MPKRIFIDWSKSCLKEAAKLLTEGRVAGSHINLSNVIVATPGARAGRRLLELLVFEAENLDCSLAPPRFTTPGGLPELLYKTISVG
ncbi:MAG: hypothetical protein R3A13_04255 [Bdellovibrionota bacterium]